MSTTTLISTFSSIYFISAIDLLSQHADYDQNLYR